MSAHKVGETRGKVGSLIPAPDIIFGRKSTARHGPYRSLQGTAASSKPRFRRETDAVHVSRTQGKARVVISRAGKQNEATFKLHVTLYIMIAISKAPKLEDKKHISRIHSKT